jgi:hypothetical protein
MKHFVSISLAVIVCFCMLIATAQQAFGYVDPGSGLLALQGIGSAAAAFAYFMRRRILALFTRATPAAAKDGNSAKPA